MAGLEDNTSSLVVQHGTWFGMRYTGAHSGKWFVQVCNGLGAGVAWYASVTT